MAHNLIETPTSGSAVSVPDPGDARTAASVEVPFQALTNRVAYLEAHAEGAVPAIVQIPLEAGVVDFAVGGNWQFVDNIWQQTSVAAPAKLWVPLRLPVGVVLVNVILTLAGNAVEGSGAHSSLPATMPKLTLRRVVPTSVTTSAIGTVVATATDPSATTGTYDATHIITLSMSEAISGVTRYSVVIEGEFGSGALANRLAVFGLSATYSPP